MYQFLICSTDLYVQNGRKVICGTQSGALLLYSWGHFKDCRYSMSNIFRWSVVDSHFCVLYLWVVAYHLISFPWQLMLSVVMGLNMFVGFPVIALLISPRTLLMLCWRLVYFVLLIIPVGFHVIECAPTKNFNAFCISLMKIGSSLDLKMDSSGEKCWKVGGFTFICSQVSLFLLVYFDCWFPLNSCSAW